jgi:hypothetical protein
MVVNTRRRSGYPPGRPAERTTLSGGGGGTRLGSFVEMIDKSAWVYVGKEGRKQEGIKRWNVPEAFGLLCVRNV